MGLVLAFPQAQAAEFVCQEDVPEPSYGPEEQRLVDQFWAESLVYLGQYLKTLETPTGQCLGSAQATVQTYSSKTGEAQTRCILTYRDMELMARHLRAIVAEPDKAKACFDPQNNYDSFTLYTPSREVQALSPVARWLDRPLLTDYYREMGGAIGEAGLELNENFVAVTSRTDTTAHWTRDVSINGLPTLWSSVGWVPFYAENPAGPAPEVAGLAGGLHVPMPGPALKGPGGPARGARRLPVL